MATLTPEQQATIAKIRGTGTIGAQSIGDSMELGYNVESGPQTYDKFGGQTWDENVTGYRDTGDAMQKRTANQLDQTQANEARGYQMGSLENLRTAANGGAPSQAAFLGQGMTSSALGAGMAAGGAARGGPGGAIAGMRAAMTGTGQQLQQNNAQVMALRNKESATDMGTFAGAAGAVRGQDIGAATTNAQLTAQQQALNEAAQQNYERMALDTRKTQLDTGMTAQGQHNQNVVALKEASKNAQASNLAAGTMLFNTATGMATGGASAAVQAAAARRKASAPAPAPKPDTTSDERAKYSVGSLGHLMGGR